MNNSHSLHHPHPLKEKLKKDWRFHLYFAGFLLMVGFMASAGIVSSMRGQHAAKPESIESAAVAPPVQDTDDDPEETQAEAELPENLKIMAKTYRAAAKKGDVIAQYELGKLYFQGKGVHQNVRMSATWWKKAADKNYLPAVIALGKLYAHDHKDVLEEDNLPGPKVGMKSNSKMAFKFYQNAADLGDAEGENLVAVAFSEGRGTRKDMKEAVKYWKKAAEKGQKDAMKSLIKAYQSGKGIKKDSEKAAYWQKKLDHGDKGQKDDD
ncbi:sel1 repeat family protein [Acetobacteraceae bacterium]|nr:sel1 repeat family protein [Acetobacteraceae bacterium]